MSILYELRYPSRWYTKILMLIVALAFFCVLATTAIAGFVIYRIVEPQRSSSDINMETFPGRPDAMPFTVPSVSPGARDGWFFPGFRGAPTILLCHGYESSKGELLTMVSALQDHQYNVFVFDFAAHGANSGMTTFGFQEAEEVRAAINAVSQRNDVDPRRFGVWGYNLGAYAALREAEDDKRVRALILDSVYDRPQQMVKVEVERAGLGRFPLMVRAAQYSFTWLNHAFRMDPPLSAGMKTLEGVPKLFIEAADDPELAEITREMFAKAPEPREQVTIPRGNFVSLDDAEKRAYENRVVSYFLLRLPPDPRLTE